MGLATHDLKFQFETLDQFTQGRVAKFIFEHNYYAIRINANGSKSYNVSHFSYLLK